jgi:hypothetical protein
VSAEVVRVVLRDRPPQRSIKWTYRYVHPLDECANGGMSWEITVQEFAPGLISFQHPRCSWCGIEPVVDDFRKEPDDDFVPWRTVRLSPED